ncbi:MAG: F0F1 ATP synthase subunit B [Armatimonadetes bacterium]|nr:F0F1 ATP synthase subunit B [Armatimonadota bacterium]
MDILNIDPRVLIVQILGFLVLLVIFRRFLFKPIAGILEARQNEVEARYRDAEAQQAAAEELKAEYQQHLARTDEEMRAKITEALKEGQAMRDEIIADSRAKAEDILAKAEMEILREKQKALVELKSAVANLVVDAAGKLIEKELDDAKHRELIGKFIEDLTPNSSSTDRGEDFTSGPSSKSRGDDVTGES